MQIELTHGRGQGHWHRILLGEFDDRPRWGAIVWCPQCGLPMLMHQHTVDIDGYVHPSLGHPPGYPQCQWHPTEPRLVGWHPEPRLPDARPIEHCAKCGRGARHLSGWGTWNGPGLLCPPCIAAGGGAQ